MLSDSFARSISKVAESRKRKELMTPEYVSDQIIKATLDCYPQDRYTVVPNLKVQTLVRVCMHFPNYLLVLDALKIKDRDKASL